MPSALPPRCLPNSKILAPPMIFIEKNVMKKYSKAQRVKRRNKFWSSERKDALTSY